MTEVFYDHLAKTRHQIHQHPEVSGEEHETTVFLKAYLKNLGVEPLNYPLKTGLIAEIGSGHPIIALRADIDALPIKEKTGLPYASDNGAMHACGHDFHQTSLLGAAQLLKEREAELKGTVRLIFQPAEENFQGAYQVLVEEKYGVDMEEITNPWHAAVSSFLSFSVGSLPPTLAILLFPDPYRIPITAVVVALTLILTGYVSAKLGKAPVKQAMLRNLAVGLLTMLVTYVVGQVFHVNV